MAKIEEEKRRLCILVHLNNSTHYECGDQLLKEACRAQGIPSTIDKVRITLGWLEEQDLVTAERHPDMVIGKATRLGLDVARGERRIAGIAPLDP